MKKIDLNNNKFIKLHKYYDNPKNVIIFYSFCLITFVFTIIGIVLTTIDANNYHNFIAIQKSIMQNSSSSTTLTLPDITKFIYGLFFIVISIIMIIFCVLFGNSTFNKKLKE
ncbi:hypothetical protein [Malacoplasma iowae]|uniref:hypothetical protein n=1 Tax=Malacoplasma iowae TaxID=2116 RepID=UPI002A18AA28|nr:hypothetical protein [Malacoplasma iowae]WPL38825.1 hypothetical protein QX181_04635 [Malacoplasma iowae]WPL40143.1 hypothetical protein QX183_01145 [Malacoplasma iowae]